MIKIRHLLNRIPAFAVKMTGWDVVPLRNNLAAIVSVSHKPLLGCAHELLAIPPTSVFAVDGDEANITPAALLS